MRMPGLTAELQGLARLRSEHPGEDGSARLLVELADGQTVESVLLPRDGAVRLHPGRLRGGLRVLHDRPRRPAAPARQRRDRRPGGAGPQPSARCSKVVFMGMGEPAHNLDNVLEAIDLLGTEGGIGHKNLVFSTVGDRRVFERLPQGRGEAGAGAVAAHHRRRPARAAAAAGAAHRPGRAGRTGRALRARHRLPDPVPVDAARRHQRRRRRARRHRRACWPASTR